jgi:stress-induced morphogen
MWGSIYPGPSQAACMQEVVDTSGGCGSAFEVRAVSPLFAGKTLLQRHRLINECLRAELATGIHALSIKQATPPPPPAAAALGAEQGA